MLLRQSVHVSNSNTSRVVSVVHRPLAMPPINRRPANIFPINRQMLFVDNIRKKNIINHLAILFINQNLSK